jgi:hypothetical protein
MPRRLVDTVDAYQRAHRWLGFPLAVVYKFADDQGPYLAALITFYGFLSLFPLLLLLVTILGFVLDGDPDLQAKLIDSALVQFPVIGSQLRENVQSLKGSGIGLAVGILATRYGCLGAADGQPLHPRGAGHSAREIPSRPWRDDHISARSAGGSRSPQHVWPPPGELGQAADRPIGLEHPTRRDCDHGLADGDVIGHQSHATTGVSCRGTDHCYGVAALPSA